MAVVAVRKLPVMKWIVGFPIAKGIILGATTVAVVHNSGLSTFAAALIIAMVSAVIGAVGVVMAAVISSRVTDQEWAERQEILKQLADLKESAGVSRRKEDQKSDDSS